MSTSWILRNKVTKEVICETFDKRKVDALNTDKYESVPIQQHLAGLKCEHFWLPIYYQASPGSHAGVLDTRPHSRCTECGKTQPQDSEHAKAVEPK